MNTQTISHNIKMVLYTTIPIILGIYSILQGSMTLPSWVVTAAAILALIEHAFNGNTPTNAAAGINVETPTEATSPVTAADSVPTV